MPTEYRIETARIYFARVCLSQAWFSLGGGYCAERFTIPGSSHGTK